MKKIELLRNPHAPAQLFSGPEREVTDHRQQAMLAVSKAVREAVTPASEGEGHGVATKSIQHEGTATPGGLY